MIQPPNPCLLCPRRCGANRALSSGACGGGRQMRVARCALHFWEEPCISGTRGSGAVFFCGCPLRCRFCQNAAISRGDAGQPIDIEQLTAMLLSLQAQRAHNLNLVTGTHYLPWIRQAVGAAQAQGLQLPIVWNTGGYESAAGLALLRDFVSIYLCDLKFFSASLSAQLAGAPDYFENAAAAVQTMCEVSGPPVFDDDGLLQRGVIVRLLVLPGHRDDAKALLCWMAANLPKDGFLLSLMRQYTPPGGVQLPRPLGRPLSSFEYKDVLNTAIDLGFTQGFTQQRGSLGEDYIPDFDGTGVPPAADAKQDQHRAKPPGATHQL